MIAEIGHGGVIYRHEFSAPEIEMAHEDAARAAEELGATIENGNAVLATWTYLDTGRTCTAYVVFVEKVQFVRVILE